jgi:uncharacterized membrane protein required for colicin V production
MLIVIFIILIIVAIILKSYDWEFIGIILGFLSGIGLITSLLCMFYMYTTSNTQIEVYKETYKAIEYKITSETCKDEFGLLSKEIVDDIQEWNENITLYKQLNNNIWLNIFIPNAYEQFELIEYTEYKTGR